MATHDFSTDHLKGKSKKIADSITKWYTERFGEAPDGGGCKAFYSTKEWKDRGEDYGTESLLILCHDGGDLYYLCNYEAGCYKTIDDFQAFLQREHGVYVEQCTPWYSAVYPV